jgi:ribosomal protein S18 acetylase RimI-like enzyme
MEITSLGWRTDLAMLEHSGSVVEDRGDHLAVHTPDNPTYWWGNFLLLEDAPRDEEGAQRWLDVFAAEHPGARHVALGVDGVDDDPQVLDALTALGLEGVVSTVMTATSVNPPPRPNTEATYRPLESDADWEQQVELSMVGEEIGYDLEFCTARVLAQRALVERGYGAWWGAFDGERLVSSMGLFKASPGLARFQTVKTHPDARGRGLAGTLIHQVSRFGFDELGAHTLVMVADPDYLAIRVYRRIGFTDSERQLQVERKPSS